MVFNFQKFERLEITATATRDNFKLKTLRWTNSTIFLQDILLISRFLHISYILGKYLVYLPSFLFPPSPVRSVFLTCCFLRLLYAEKKSLSLTHPFPVRNKLLNLKINIIQNL